MQTSNKTVTKRHFMRINTNADCASSAQVNPKQCILKALTQEFYNAKHKA